MTRCHTLHSRGRAIAAQHGNNAAITLCLLESLGGAITVAHQRTRVVVAHCKAVSHGEEIIACGVSAGGFLRLQGGEVAARDVACEAWDGAALVATDARLTAGLMRGVVSVMRAATAALLRCDVYDGVIGVHVTEGGRVRAKDTRVVNMIAPRTRHAARGPEGSPMPAFSAAYACSGSQLTIEGGAVRNCEIGVDVASWGDDPASSVLMHGLDLMGYVSGMQVQEGCEVEVVGCEFWGSQGIDPRTYTRGGRDVEGGDVEGGDVIGLDCPNSKRVAVRGCVFDGNDVHICADVPEGVFIEKCEFQDLAEAGRGTAISVFAQTWVEECSFMATATAVCARGRGKREEGTPVTCAVRRCVFREDMVAGVVAEHCARVEVCSSEMHSVRSGMFALSGADLTVSHCAFHRCEIAIGVRFGGGMLTARVVTTDDCGTAVPAGCMLPIGGRLAPQVAGHIRINLKHCKLRATRQSMFAHGEGTVVTAAKCELSSHGTAVVVESGGSMHMYDSSVRATTRGVQVGEEAEELQKPCEICGLEGREALARAQSMVALAELYPSPDLGGWAGSRCPHQGARAQAMLADVTVRGFGEAAVQVTPHGRVNAVHVQVSGSKVGFCLRSLDAAKRSSFGRCTVALPAAVDGAVAVDAQEMGLREEGAEVAMTFSEYDVVGVETIAGDA